MRLNRESLTPTFALMALLVFAVAGCQNGGSGSDNSPVTGITTLAAPTNLRVTLDADSTTLRWDPVAGAEGYRIYWNQTGQVTLDDAWMEPPDGQLSHRHRNLLPGHAYHYRLAALGEQTPGQLSAELRVVLPDGLPPATDGAP